MDLQSTRMWCLRTAVEHNGNIDAVLAAAERMMTFIDGAGQASSVSEPTAIDAAESAVVEAEAPATEAVIETSTPEAHVDPIAACGTALVMSESGTLAEAVPSIEVVNAEVEAVVEAAAEEVSQEATSEEAGAEAASEDVSIETASEVVVEAAPEEVSEEAVSQEAGVETAPEEASEEAASEEAVVEAVAEEVSPETMHEEAVVEAASEEVFEETKSEEPAPEPVMIEVVSQQEPEGSNGDKIAVLLAAANQLEAQMRSLAQAMSSHPA